MSSAQLNAHRNERVTARYGNCTECEGLIVLGIFDTITVSSSRPPNLATREVPMFPARPAPRPIPAGTPNYLAQEVTEAALVLADSPKASAALSRRILQHTLREYGGFKGRNLDDEIPAAIDSDTLSQPLARISMPCATCATLGTSRRTRSRARTAARSWRSNPARQIGSSASSSIYFSTTSRTPPSEQSEERGPMQSFRMPGSRS
jgi:hypothetical protein